MKPWEESWYPYEDTAGELDVYRDLDAEGSRVRVLASDSARDEDKARVKLAAAAPEMARLLLAFYKIEDRGCFSLDCNGPFDDGTHDVTCEVRIVLEKAGVLEAGHT